MQKKFEINRTMIKGGFQSERKEVPQNSKSDLPLALVVFFSVESKRKKRRSTSHAMILRRPKIVARFLERS